ncbi:MAG TPA: PLP-dependent transferase, partial [Actinoplanes sp.]|nr:PLP-dependent transferase [Actinoplanes sp.]
VRVVAAAARAAGALVAVDNTTATPLGQRPLELGADLTVASGTKALTGHSDVMLGYVATNDTDLLAALATWRKQTGGIAGPFDSWLAHRSIATLDLRLARQSQNAAAVADLLSRRSDVEGVRWPGLSGDPSYPIATAQMRRIPGIVGFDLGSAERVARFLTASALVFAATSFGGVHTTADRRAQWGDDTSAGFVRLSCGIEDTPDLLADLTAALDRAG